MTFKLTSTAFAIAISSFVAFGLVACNGDETEETMEEHDHGDPVPECEAISSVCHGVGPLSELAEECHDLGHANHADDCIERQDECVTHCEGLAGVGGAGGAH